MSKKFLSLVIALAVVFAMFIPMTASAAVVTPVADPSEFNTVVGGWYISPDGGYKFYMGGTWAYYGMFGLTLVQDSNIPTNAATFAVYPADDETVFENKTQDDFETVLQESATKFEKRTIGNSDFTMYYCQTSVYENYVFQANGQKYFINFIWAVGDRDEFTKFAEDVMATIVIADDPERFDVIYKVDGSEYARDTYIAGETITPVAAPEREGYEFSGWSEIPEVMPEEDVVVEGTFTKVALDSYEVIYYVDGVEYARELYEIGAAITAIDAPVKEGYTFSGWSEIPEVMGEEDIIVNGTFTANQPSGNPETGDNTALITIGAVAVLAFVAIIASKKRATSK